jgi:hypothetical protein
VNSLNHHKQNSDINKGKPHVNASRAAHDFMLTPLKRFAALSPHCKKKEDHTIVSPAPELQPSDIQDGAVPMGLASVGDGLDMHLDEIEQLVLGTDVNDADPHQSEGPRFNRPTAAELCHLPWSNRTCLGTVTVEDEEDLEEFEEDLEEEFEDDNEPLDQCFMEHNIDEEGGLTAKDLLNEEFE